MSSMIETSNAAAFGFVCGGLFKFVTLELILA
jgi:hypothetical protein